MDGLLHGSAHVNPDGRRKSIATGENCFIGTDKCFWNNAHDAVKCTKTGSMTKNKSKASLKTINDYFNDKEKDNDMI